jgi:hypothetical protein
VSDIKVTFSIPQEVVNLADRVQRNLVTKILPQAIGKAVPVVRDSIKRHLPDGVSTGTRAKQSAKAKARFKYHMKDRVKAKMVSDVSGHLRIVGVDEKAAHVNFDHGEKAKTIGRVHKLWWVKDKHEVYHDPKHRKQTQDIPRLVQAETQDQVQSIIEQHVRSAVASGGLTK